MPSSKPFRPPYPSMLGPGLALCALLASPGAAASGPWVVHEQARVRLLAAASSGSSAPPADAGAAEAAGASGIDLGLEFELEPGWHVYWKNSGDAGYPPRIDFSKSPSLAGAELLFPAPHRFDLPGGLVSFGYEDRVLYPISRRLETGEGAAPHSPVEARLDYLVCREECIPYTAQLTLDLAAARRSPRGEEEAIATRLAEARAALPAAPRTVEGAPEIALRAEPAADSALVLEVAVTGGALRAATPDLFFDVHPFFALEKPELRATAAGLRFRVPFRARDETQPLPATTTFAWTLTGLERAAGAPVALAGAASVEIPHLRSSGAPAVAGAEGLGTQLLVALPVLVGALALFLLYRSRRAR
jgi:suppressor for copper-sensitivity B